MILPIFKTLSGMTTQTNQLARQSSCEYYKQNILNRKVHRSNSTV